MNRLEEFLWANRLKQKDLADYLGITSAGISKAVKAGKLSASAMMKIHNNTYGWDLSMFIESTEESVNRPNREKKTGDFDEVDLEPIGEELAWYKRMFQELTRRVMDQDMIICDLKKKLEDRQ